MLWDTCECEWRFVAVLGIRSKQVLDMNAVFSKIVDFVELED